MECAYYYEPSPPAIGGQSSIELTNASPETSSSGISDYQRLSAVQETGPLTDAYQR